MRTRLCVSSRSLLVLLIICCQSLYCFAAIKGKIYDGLPLPESCMNTDLTATYNGVKVPLVRCLADDPLPQVCNVLMPNFTSLYDSPAKLVVVNAGQCGRYKTFVDIPESETDPFKFCWGKCLEKSQASGWTCRMARITFFNITGRTPQCYLASCKGQEASDSIKNHDMNMIGSNTWASHRTFWVDRIEACVSTLKTWVPPTAAPTMAPTYSVLTAAYFDPTPQTDLMTSNTNDVLLEMSKQTYDTCANTCVKTKECQAINFWPSSGDCTLVKTYDATMTVQSVGGIIFVRNDNQLPADGIPTKEPTRRPTSEGETWMPTMTPTPQPTNLPTTPTAATINETSISSSTKTKSVLIVILVILLLSASIGAFYYIRKNHITFTHRKNKKNSKMHEHDKKLKASHHHKKSHKKTVEPA